MRVNVQNTSVSVVTKNRLKSEPGFPVWLPEKKIGYGSDLTLQLITSSGVCSAPLLRINCRVR
jgi:hypothetical protein